jgi:retinal rod rhodopsin-sensitive cGMP 3',5'-cyclic phosphodiesterase subunit delta
MDSDKKENVQTLEDTNYHNNLKHSLDKEKYPDKTLLDETISEDLLEKIRSGFKINHLKMKDGDNGKVLWETDKFNLSEDEKQEDLPKELLNCKVVVREVNFSSKEKISDLELIQNFYLFGELIETARFYFGFVIPDSTNNWEQVVEAKPPEEMLSAEELSGNLVVEIMFLSMGEVIVRNRIVINYV